MAMFEEFRILKPFLKDVDREFHLRELARFLKKSPATVEKYMEHFVKLGLIVKRKMRIYTLYSANKNSPVFMRFKRFYRSNKMVLQK